MFNCFCLILIWFEFSAAFTHFQNFTHKSKNHTQNASHLLQNEALHSRYHNHVSKANICNTFNIILIIVRFVCYIENCVLCFMKSVMKLKTLVSGFADLVCASTVWVSAFRNCVKSKDLVCIKQLKKTVNSITVLATPESWVRFPVNADDSVCF